MLFLYALFLRTVDPSGSVGRKDRRRPSTRW